MNDNENKKIRWMENNSPSLQLISTNIIPLNPEIGFYIKVNGLEISEEFFPEQYKQISESYQSVIKEYEIFI